METSVAEQAAALALAFLMGVGDGLFYDLLRPFRYRLKKLGAAVLDGVFCAGAGIGAYLYAMGAGDGRLGVCQLAAVTAGFLLYILRLSPGVWALLRRRGQKSGEK